MTIPRIDYFNFLFNGGRGIRTDQLAGSFIESLTEDETTGIVTVVARLADGMEVTLRLDGSLLINAAPDADPQPAATVENFAARRLWWDGVTLRYLKRVPGHGLVVEWPNYEDDDYVGEHRDPPVGIEVGQFFYHLGAHGFLYRVLVGGSPVFRAGTPQGWRGHVDDRADAEAHVSADDQLFEWNQNVHISSGYVAPVDDAFLWESLIATHALSPDEAEDSESDAQGTVSGRRLSGAIDAHAVGLHTWRHELRLDYRQPAAGEEPQFRFLNVAGNERIIDFQHLTAPDEQFIREVPVDSLIAVGDAIFTVGSFSDTGGAVRLRGVFDEVPELVDETNYRLRFSALVVHALSRGEIDDPESDVDGLVSGRGLNRAVQEYTPDEPPRVSSIPEIEGAPTLYLTHDEHLGGANDLTVTVGVDDFERVGWSSGHDLLAAFGSLADDDEPGPLLAIYGAGTIDDYTITHVVLSSRHLAGQIHRIKIGALFYEVLPGFGHLANLAVVELADPPTLAVPAFTFNIRTSPTASYYTDGAERTNEAGLWEWSQDSRPRAYERLQDAFENELDAIREAAAASGDEFIMRAGSDRHINPARASGRDVGNLRTAHAGSLAATEQWLYAGHGNSGFTRYLLADNGATRNQAGLAGSMENARQSTSSPNSRFGHAIDGNRFYLGFRDGANTTIASWEFDDEEVAQAYAAPSPDNVVLSVPNAHIEELAVITVHEGDTTDEVDPGVYMVICFATGNPVSAVIYRSLNGGAFAQWGSFSLSAVINQGENLRSVAFQILNEQLLLYVGVPQAGDVNHIVVINTGINSRIDSARIEVDEAFIQGLAIGAVNDEQILYASKSNDETEINAYRAYRYVGAGDLVRVDWPITAQAQRALDSGLRVRETRQVVGGGVLLASNNFGFDLSGDGTIAVGNYTFEPVPVADVTEIAATIRVGGRAGFIPLRFSGEQFRYVGETPEPVAGTWPFGGSGGTTWGNVSEIPCAMLYMNHRAEGVVKAELLPQRQQIRWTMDGSNNVTAVLMFFNYDADDENLTGIRLVSFTDQVIEIEGFHVHFLRGAD